VVLDIEAFGLEESLLHRDPPGAIVGIAVALQIRRDQFAGICVDISEVWYAKAS
jgi:hypothetical protein